MQFRNKDFRLPNPLWHFCQRGFLTGGDGAGIALRNAAGLGSMFELPIYTRHNFRLCIGFHGKFYLLLRLQILLWAAIVRSVSASCVSVAPSRFNSSSVSLQARVLAMAVMEAVNSQEFTIASPPHYPMGSVSFCCFYYKYGKNRNFAQK